MDWLRFSFSASLQSMTNQEQSRRCPGCGGFFSLSDGPTHPYMISSAGCWERYGRVLAREYSEPKLLLTHRLSVDTYAVQHPGSGSRQAIQSVGLHLARLMLQVDAVLPPDEANDVMLGLGKHKASLPLLRPPRSFDLTVLDIPLSGTAEEHSLAVQAWARATWINWLEHHAFIREWVEQARRPRPENRGAVSAKGVWQI